VVGVTLIYALSGIALNHIADWNPSYELTHEAVHWPRPSAAERPSRAEMLAFLDLHGERDNYKNHYYPEPHRLKIFVKSGIMEVDLNTGQGTIERIKRRRLFFEVNYLHYNPGRIWTWFSDIYCVVLIIVTITGLFVLKGKKGITGRGAWLTGLGVVIPLVFLVFYL
jgi:hypothetical protein